MKYVLIPGSKEKFAERPLPLSLELATFCLPSGRGRWLLMYISALRLKTYVDFQSSRLSLSSLLCFFFPFYRTLLNIPSGECQGLQLRDVLLWKLQRSGRLGIFMGNVIFFFLIRFTLWVVVTLSLQLQHILIKIMKEAKHNEKVVTRELCVFWREQAKSVLACNAQSKGITFHLCATLGKAHMSPLNVSWAAQTQKGKNGTHHISPLPCPSSLCLHAVSLSIKMPLLENWKKSLNFCGRHSFLSSLLTLSLLIPIFFFHFSSFIYV